MTSLGPCDTLGLSVEVHNTGGRDGDEVVQLYTRQPEATVPVPNIRLVAFERVTIPAGKTAEVELTVARLKRMRSMISNPQQHHIALTAMFGELGFETPERAGDR